MICAPSTSGCTTLFSSRCVYYDGPSTTNIGYIPNMSLTDLLLLIDSIIGGETSGTFINSTDTINVSGVGISSQPYELSVIISSDSGNALTNSNGLYVPETIVPDPPGLQEVTDVGNVTTDQIVAGSFLTGGGVSSNPKMFVSYNGAITSHVIDAQTSTGSSAPLTILSSTLLLNASQTAIINAANGVTLQHQSNVQVKFNNTTTNTFFSDGRLSGANATSNNEFITLEQGDSRYAFPFNAQNTNTVFAGPPIGGSAAPTFRLLVPADIPSLDAAKITSGTFPILRGGTGLNAVGSPGQHLVVNGAGTGLQYVTLDAVTISGNQTITGSKTFNSSIQIDGSQASVVLRNTASVQGASLYYNDSVNEVALSVIPAVAPTRIVLLHQQDIQIKTGTNTVTNTIFVDGRMSGTAASNANEFVTKAQLDSVTAFVVSSASIDSSAVTATYMNTNHDTIPVGGVVAFTNLSDAPTQVLFVRKYAASTWSTNVDTKLT